MTSYYCYEYNEPLYPVFQEVWGLVDSGKIDREVGHRMLGRYFGYPECCIEAFILSALWGKNTGQIYDEFKWCNDCGEQIKIIGGEAMFYCWDCLPLEGVSD